MRPLTRFAATVAAGLLGLTALSLTTPVADAASTVSITGSAPAVAHGPGTVTFSYTITLPNDVTSARFSTHQDAHLPAATTGVTLDGATVPAGQISRPSSVDIAVQAGPAPVDGLLAGTHTVTFQVQVSAAGSADTSSTATLSWTDGGGAQTLTSLPVTMQINQPDLAVTLTPDTGEDQVGFLGTGVDLDLLVDVANNGYGAPWSTLTITLPVGMTLGTSGVVRDTDGSNLTCVNGPGSSVQCDLGPVAAGSDDPTLDIDLTTVANEPIGSTVPVTVSVAPNANEGTDTNPSNDSTTVQVLYTGSARLSYRITPASTEVVLGRSTKVTLTVHNDGPQPAPATVALAIVIGSQFTVTNFTGDTQPPAEMTGPATAAHLVQHAHLLATPSARPGGVATAPAASGGTGVLWYIGNLASGGSVSSVLTMKATALGRSQLQLLAVSGAGDPNCNQFTCTPAASALTVVPVPVVVPAPAGTTATPAAPTLANTGASNRVGVIGGGLLLLGAGLMLGARRRITARR